MTTAYFSPSSKTFIPAAWKSDGTYNENTWPSDAVLLTQEMSDEFWRQTPPEGKQLGAVNGLPAWVDVPPLTKEQLTSIAEQKKLTLRSVADSTILPLQDAVDLSMATEDEKKALIAWKTYRVLLNRVDATIAPDITWPEQPSQ